MKINKNSGIYFKSEDSKLSVIKPVLKSWIKIVEEYSTKMDWDACYWYNERANISVLSGAAWKTPSWLALEEFGTVKHSKSKEAKTAHGRSDLYITKENHENSFAIEAKQAWQNIGDNADHLNSTKIKFSGAWNDAGNLEKDEASTRVAACFVTPYILKKQFSTHESQFSTKAQVELNEVVLKWLNSVNENLKPDVIAWIFPQSDKKDQVKELDGYVYPGVCLLLKIRSRSNK